MFQALFNLILGLLSTILQIILLPFNTLLAQFLPDLSAQISSIVPAITDAMAFIPWVLSMIPSPIRSAIQFSLVLAIVKYSVSLVARNSTKVWNVIQKIKFW